MAVPKWRLDTATPTEYQQLINTDKPFNLLVKDTTGNPSTGTNGWVVINTFDSTISMYADGAWRVLGTWITTGLQFPLSFPLTF